MNKGLKKVLSYALITSMVASMALTGFGGGARTVKADDQTDTLDSVSLVNFSTILGRAVDFGIVADTYHQENHSETNMAVKVFMLKDSTSNDPDLAGGKPISYIIGQIKKDEANTSSGRLTLDKVPQSLGESETMTVNIETTTQIIENTINFNKQGGEGGFPNPDNCKGFISFNGKTDTNATKETGGTYGKFAVTFRENSLNSINNNVQSMIDHIVDESNDLKGKVTSGVTLPTSKKTSFTLDLSDAKYAGKTVYINVDDNLMEAIKTTAGLTIKKASSTVVVFNVPQTEVYINKFVVIPTGGSGVDSQTTDSGNDSAHNADVDTEICRKVVWNLYNATDVTLNTAAGTFLLPQPSSTINVVGSSAGWIASAGKVTNSSAEFHYIYKGRSETVSSNVEGAMHFALRKAIYTDTKAVSDNGVKAQVKPNERDDIDITAGQFKFDLWETGNDYDINAAGATKITATSVANDQYSKVLFPDLTFTSAGKHYYVIKETGSTGNTDITQSTGEIRIEVKVDASLNFKVQSWHYLTAEDADSNEYYKWNRKDKDENGDPINPTYIDMSGNEFSLGGFYNQYKEGGNLEITKEVTGTDEAYAPSTDTFELTLTATLSDRNTPLVGTFDAENLLSGTSVTFNSSGVATLNVADNSDITIKGLPDGAIVTVAETNKEHYNLQNQSTELEKTIAEGTTETVALQNEYTAPRGSLTITKTYAGITDSQIPHPTETLFQVTDKNGVTIAMIDWSQGTGSGLTRTFTVDNLPIGTYHVKEIRQNQTISGYSLEVGAKVNDTTQSLGADYGVDATVVESPATTQVDFTNTYVKNGSITVTKIVDGLQGTASLPSDYVIEYFDGTTKMGELTTNVDCSGLGTTSNPFTWIVDVPAGKTVTFVESNYAVTGYDLTITTNPAAVTNEPNKVISAAVPSGGNIAVAFTNTYSRKMVDLTVNKTWIVNPNGTDIPDSLTLTLKGSTSANANYSTQSVTLNKSDYAANATTWTKVINVPEYDEVGNLITYEWIEENVPNGYALTGNVTSDSTTTITNTTPVPEFGSLKINKVVSGNDARATSDYIVTVRGDDGNYYNANGVISNNANITVVGGGNVTINNLPVQKYTITESRTLAEVSNYTLDIQYTGLTEGKVQVSKDATSEVTITNTYTQCGSVEIEKVASGDPFPANAPSFPISISFDTDGTYTVAECPLGGAQHAAPLGFTANTAVTYNLHAGDKIIISGVPAGVEYTVSEGDISALTDYAKVGISGAVDTSGKGTIASGVKKEVDVTNRYTTPVIQTGSIKVTKEQASGSDNIPAQDAFPISVTFNDTSAVTYQVTTTSGGVAGTPVDYAFAANAEHKITVSLKYGDSFVISGVPQGTTYTVTEDITGLSSDYGTPTLTNASGTIGATQVEATVANTYTAQAPAPNGITVNFSKRETGKTEELPRATLQLLNGTTSVSQFQSGTTPVSINNLGAGTYTLKELVPPPDYQCAADITFSIEEDTNNPGTLIVKRDGQEVADKTIVMFDDKVPMKEVSFSKVSIGNIGKIAGAKLTLYSVGANGVLTYKIDWTSSETDVYKFTLAAGDYAIEETVAPEGYVKASSLVKFNLSFDTNGNAVIKVTEGPGEYDATNDVILIKNDPIKVTGKLSVHVEEKKTGRPVPDAEVEVTGPDGTTTYKTNGNGEIVDVNGNTPIDVPAGKYKVTVKKVPAGYEVETGQTAEVEVPENKEGRHIAKIVSSTGGLKIKVLEEGTNREVPDATVVVEAPEGVKFPDGSTKITAVTDKNGNITTYTGSDGKTYDLTSGLTPGDYKITVTKVPAGYQVTTGETKTKKVVKDEVAEHVALIATSSSVKPAPAPAPAPAATPAATPATPTGSITNSINVKTGDDMNVYPALIAMALSLITGASVVAFRRKRETK